MHMSELENLPTDKQTDRQDNSLHDQRLMKDEVYNTILVDRLNDWQELQHSFK